MSYDYIFISCNEKKFFGSKLFDRNIQIIFITKLKYLNFCCILEKLLSLNPTNQVVFCDSCYNI